MIFFSPGPIGVVFLEPTSLSATGGRKGQTVELAQAVVQVGWLGGRERGSEGRETAMGYVN